MRVVTYPKPNRWANSRNRDLGGAVKESASPVTLGVWPSGKSYTGASRSLPDPTVRCPNIVHARDRGRDMLGSGWDREFDVDSPEGALFVICADIRDEEIDLVPLLSKPPMS